MDDDTKLLNLALDAGEIMLTSGADSFRQRTKTRRSPGAVYHAHCEPAP